MKTHTHAQTPGPCIDGIAAAAWESSDSMHMLANARLIAAAPDLLAALEDLLQERYVDGDESDQEFDAAGNWTCNSPASIKARAAIARAKGTP